MSAPTANSCFCENSCIGDAVIWRGPASQIQATLVIGAGFAIVYHIAAWAIYPCIEARLQEIPSKYENENNRHWFSSHVQSTVHALIVLYMAFVPTVILSFVDPEIQFAIPDKRTCQWNKDNGDSVAWVANASLVFLAHLISDLVAGLIYKHIDKTTILHHLCFISFVYVVQYNCFLAYVAGCFLLMEISTIVLNYFSFFRNRLGYEHWSVKLSFLIFAILFALFRMLLGVVSAIEYFAATYRGKIPGVGILSTIFVCAGITASIGMNVMWLYGITKKTIKMYTAGPDDGISYSDSLGSRSE